MSTPPRVVDGCRAGPNTFLKDDNTLWQCTAMLTADRSRFARFAPTGRRVGAASTGRLRPGLQPLAAISTDRGHMRVVVDCKLSSLRPFLTCKLLCDSEVD